MFYKNLHSHIDLIPSLKSSISSIKIDFAIFISICVILTCTRSKLTLICSLCTYFNFQVALHYDDIEFLKRISFSSHCYSSVEISTCWKFQQCGNFPQVEKRGKSPQYENFLSCEMIPQYGNMYGKFPQCGNFPKHVNFPSVESFHSAEISRSALISQVWKVSTVWKEEEEERTRARRTFWGFSTSHKNRSNWNFSKRFSATYSRERGEQNIKEPGSCS